ncbi:MAG: CpXC domain-containing protein [Anaerolineae bacterium]
MFQPQVASVTCPLCGRRFAAQVQSIIDVGQDPEAKSKLLRGQINVATCPQCGNAGMLNVPFVYHDPDKEMLLCFLPPELDLKGNDQHKLVGDLTNRLINSLPPEERKGYLLQPKIFLSLPGLMDEVLQAEGVTKEMLEARKAKLNLIQRFLDATSDEVLRVLVRENDGQLDYEFFSLLTGSIEMAKAEGEEDRAKRLLGLRERLLEFSSLGKASRVEREVAEALEEGMTREEFLEKVVECESDAELKAVIALGRRMLDYQFFRSLTSKIEAHEGEGNAEEAQRLKDLRSRILEIRDRLDAETQAILQKKADLLREMFESEDLGEALRDHMGEIDAAFFAVLSANIEHAEAGGDKEAARRLKRLETLAFELLEEITPRSIKFINQLMKAQYPRETKKLLEENVEQVDNELIKVIELIIEQLNRRGEKKTARQLREIRDQARATLK